MLNKKSEEVVENKENTILKKEIGAPQEKKVKKTASKKYKVISVSQYYIIVEDTEGHGIRKNGSFPNLKIGDQIEL